MWNKLSYNRGFGAGESTKKAELSKAIRLLKKSRESEEALRGVIASLEMEKVKLLGRNEKTIEKFRKNIKTKVNTLVEVENMLNEANTKFRAFEQWSKERLLQQSQNLATMAADFDNKLKEAEKVFSKAKLKLSLIKDSEAS